MINLYNTEIEDLFIHRVGNQCRKEKLFLSNEPYQIKDEIRPLLKEFFLKPFREKDEQYFKFSEESELESVLNSYGYAYNDEIEINPLVSHRIAEHLYSQGKHPHIKSGELYVCKLSNMLIDNYKVEGFGIFKSELKCDFMQFEEGASRLDIIIQQGVNMNKLDKGAIIFEDPEESKTGFRILYIDSNKYDSKYWAENFLELVELEDSNFLTRKYLKFCESFAKDVIRPAEDKHAEVEFVNDSLGFFAGRDQFNENEFKKEVIQDDSLISEFDHYKFEKGPKFQIEDITSFDISNETVSECRKKIKGEIVLDTGITLKVAKGTNAASKYLEKGWDEEKQMYYYLSYFNKEEK